MSKQTNRYIFKDQIKVALQTGEGYDNIRKLLFEDLDRLSQQQLIEFFHDIFWDLQNYLLKENQKYCIRALDIIKDLLKNYQTEFSKAINSSDMALTLYKAATHKKFVTLHREEWDDYQKRIRGLFLFWFLKYQYQESKYQNLIKYYKEMREKGVQFPRQDKIDITARVRQQKKKNEALQIKESIVVNIALEQILPIIIEAQSKLLNSPEEFKNKQYVKVLKTKNKYLYQLSIDDTSSLPEQDKKKISSYYKRIRSIMKNIDIINEDIIQKNKIRKQKAYNAEKLQLASSMKNVDSSEQIEKFSPKKGTIKKTIQAQQIQKETYKQQHKIQSMVIRQNKS